MSAVTSFRKKSSSKASHPLGTRPSFHNAQLLVSTGVPSLDPLLGGGICVGSIVLIEEDQYEHYSRVLLKYFIAEGIMCGHSIIIGSASESPATMINDLPAAILESNDQSLMPSLAEYEEEETTVSSTADEMKIAWRYENKPVVKSSFSNQFGHNFDLTKKIERERVERVTKHLFSPDCHIKSASDGYDELKKCIQASLTKVIPNQAMKGNVVNRIAIHSLGSPLWLQDTTGNATDLMCFVHFLRGIVRVSNSVALVTIPTHLYQDPTTITRLERLCDAVVRTESFEGSDKELNPLYKDYHGLFHLVKLPRVNTLTAHYPETLDLTFKLKRKRFVIEKLHLPPELSSTANRTQEDPIKAIKKGGKTKTLPLSTGTTSIGNLSTLKIQNEF